MPGYAAEAGGYAKQAGLEGVSRNPKICSKQQGGFVRCVPASLTVSSGCSFLRRQIATIRIVPRPRIVALSLHSK